MLFRFDECELDLGAVELRVGGQRLPSRPQVFDVLAYLLRHRDRMVTKEELLDEVWHHRFVTESAISSRIKALAAIGDDGRRSASSARSTGTATSSSARSARRNPAMPPIVTGVPGRRRPSGAPDDVERVLALLGEAPIVTLLGPGGVGKTRLAVEVALRCGTGAPSETWFVDLTKARRARPRPRRPGARRPHRHPGRPAPGPRGGGGALPPRRARQLRARDRCGVARGRHRAVVARDTRTGDQPDPPADLGRARLRRGAAAGRAERPGGRHRRHASRRHRRLFEQAARAADPDFRLAPHLADVVTICRMVDGLPLAIELAAGHVRTLPPALLRTRLGAVLGSSAGAARRPGPPADGAGHDRLEPRPAGHRGTAAVGWGVLRRLVGRHRAGVRPGAWRRRGGNARAAGGPEPGPAGVRDAGEPRFTLLELLRAPGGSSAPAARTRPCRPGTPRSWPRSWRTSRSAAGTRRRTGGST